MPGCEKSDIGVPIKLPAELQIYPFVFFLNALSKFIIFEGDDIIFNFLLYFSLNEFPLATSTRGK